MLRLCGSSTEDLRRSSVWEGRTGEWDKQHLDRTQRVLQAWTTRDPAAAKTEAAGLRQAIADADWESVERWGGLDAALKKISQLKQETPALNGRGMIDDFRLWGSKRCRRINAPPSKTQWRT